MMHGTPVDLFAIVNHDSFPHHFSTACPACQQWVAAVEERDRQYAALMQAAEHAFTVCVGRGEATEEALAAIGVALEALAHSR